LKIKLDENLPKVLSRQLTGLGHDVDTVPEEDLAGREDRDVWRAAQREGRFLITQDLDFSDAREFGAGSHRGLLVVRLRDPGRLALAAVVWEVFASHDVEGWKGCFAVVTERKLRLLRPART